jgi:hypothetical protein
MRRVLSSACALCLVVPLSFAAEDDRTVIETAHIKTSRWNGRPWKAFNPQEKINLVFGYVEGAVLLLIQMQDDGGSVTSIDDGVSALGQITIRGFRAYDLVQQIDAFYADSANIRIPIIEAYRYGLRKLKGATPKELGEYEAKLRKRYNQ